MEVEVRLPTVLRQHANGAAVVKVDAANIGEVLSELASKYPGMSGQLLTESGELHKFVNVYLNDDDVRYLDKLDTKLNDGDTISILPAVAGGSD
jgi:MoaD family protein